MKKKKKRKRKSHDDAMKSVVCTLRSLLDPVMGKTVIR